MKNVLKKGKTIFLAVLMLSLALGTIPVAEVQAKGLSKKEKAYYSAEEWDGPRSLRDMLGNIDDQLKRFVGDYPINLVIPKEIEDFSRFRTSLGTVLEMIKVSEDKDAMKKLLAANPRYKAMDNETVLAINTFIGANIPVNEERSETDMCKAWEEQREEGRESLIGNMLSLGRTSEEIASFAGITLDEVLKVEKRGYSGSGEERL